MAIRQKGGFRIKIHGYRRSLLGEDVGYRRLVLAKFQRSLRKGQRSIEKITLRNERGLKECVERSNFAALNAGPAQSFWQLPDSF